LGGGAGEPSSPPPGSAAPPSASGRSLTFNEDDAFFQRTRFGGRKIFDGKVAPVV
jgi:hypothetical protein